MVNNKEQAVSKLKFIKFHPLFETYESKTSRDHLREDEQIVSGGNRNRVLVRVPGGMQNLLGKVDRLHIDIVFAVLVVDAWHCLVLC